MMYAPEEEIYLSIIKWVKYDLENRKVHLFELISYLKFPLLKKSFLIKIINREPLITDDRHCQQKVIAYYEALLLVRVSELF